ncbi:MAG: glycosyltransferase family 2 protein [Sedimentisphaerales bacterium]|nr:glycosyltransferase family 2 protein [Sedimentisphaerales bacterium]
MPEDKPERIAAVVVTYNRKQLLSECLDSLLGQTHALDGLYVIDNASTDGTGEHLRDRGFASPGDGHRQEHYVRMPENVGGAGGFAEGMVRAAGAGFDWLWLMDDDVVAAPNALEVLVRKKETLQAVHDGPFILNSLVLSRDRPDGDALAFPLREISAGGSPRRGAFHWRLSDVRDQVHDGLYRWICPLNGTFLPARAVSEVGTPRREFFIYGDETDFQFRAAGSFRMYTVVDSKVFHPRQPSSVFDWKQYYNIRNMFIVNRHFDHPTLRNFKLILTGLGLGLRHGRWGMRLMLRAIRDGLTGHLGKRDDLAP